MGRKPKTKVEEESIPPSTQEPVESDTNSEIPEPTSEDTNASSFGEANTITCVGESIPLSNNVNAVLGEAYMEMAWASDEISRCNDYIYAKADLDRRFTVYRDELYEYRYKFRQLIMNWEKGSLELSKSNFPVRPDVVADI